jgi:hypothetical protein
MTDTQWVCRLCGGTLVRDMHVEPLPRDAVEVTARTFGSGEVRVFRHPVYPHAQMQVFRCTRPNCGRLWPVERVDDRDVPAVWPLGEEPLPRFVAILCQLRGDLERERWLDRLAGTEHADLAAVQWRAFIDEEIEKVERLLEARHDEKMRAIREGVSQRIHTLLEKLRTSRSTPGE